MKHFRGAGIIFLVAWLTGSGATRAQAEGTANPTTASPPTGAATPAPAGQTPQSVKELREELDSQESMITGIAPNAVRAPFGRFLLVKQGLNCLALRITEHTRLEKITSGTDVPAWDGAKYEWLLQPDGSMDFTRLNVLKGTGEVAEKVPGQDAIIAGPFHLEWSRGDWIYFPGVEAPVSMAQTEWVRLADVQPGDNNLKWISQENNMAWGNPVAGLQLGVGLETTQPYRVGESVSFVLALRNTSRKLITVLYYRPECPVPTVWNKQGNRVVLYSPAIDRPVQPVRVSLAPGQVIRLGSPRLRIGPHDAGDDPSLEAAIPGKYNVGYTYRFDSPDAKTWVGTLESGKIQIEIM